MEFVKMNIKDYLDIKDQDTFAINSDYLYIYGNKTNTLVINIQTKQIYKNYEISNPNDPLCKIFNIPIPHKEYKHTLTLNGKNLYQEWIPLNLITPNKLYFTDKFSDKDTIDYYTRKIRINENLIPFGYSKLFWEIDNELVEYLNSNPQNEILIPTTIQ